MLVTSVTGHLQSKAFTSKYSNWSTLNPQILIRDAEIEVRVEES